jgi:hypothetical protein
MEKLDVRIIDDWASAKGIFDEVYCASAQCSYIEEYDDDDRGAWGEEFICDKCISFSENSQDLFFKFVKVLGEEL